MSMALAVAVCVKKYHLIFISAYQVVQKMAPFLVGHNFKIAWKNSWIPAISNFAWHNAVIKKCQGCLWCHIVIIITVNTIWPVSSSLKASQSTNRVCWFAQKDKLCYREWLWLQQDFNRVWDWIGKIIINFWRSNPANKFHTPKWFIIKHFLKENVS